MPATFKVDAEVRAVLESSTMTDRTVKLNAKLDRDLYNKVNKVLIGAGGQWDKKTGLHIFNTDPRQQLLGTIETGKGVNLQQQFQIFYTPSWLVERMVYFGCLAEAKVNDWPVLEPSCGNGAIVDGIVKAGCRPFCVDMQWDHVKAMRDRGHTAYQQDFMNFRGRTFHRILMNPPFTNGQDIDHVNHAYSMLEPKGVLVAIMSPAYTFRSNGKWHRFREDMCPLMKHVEEIPAGAFKESGTDVKTMLVVFRK